MDTNGLRGAALALTGVAAHLAAETTGLPVAGELSKRDFGLPVSMGGAR